MYSYLICLLYLTILILIYLCVFNKIPHLALSWDDVALELSSQTQRIKDGLYLFAASNGGEEKTEKASQKKLQDTRKKGQVAKSNEINTFINLLTAFMTILIGGGWFFNQTKTLMIFFLGEATETTLLYSSMGWLIVQKGIPLLAVFLLPLMIMGVSANLAQTGFVFSGEPLKPNFKKLNPLTGAKEMFSRKRWFDLLKNIGKLIIVSWVSLSFYQSHQSELAALPYATFEDGLIIIGVFLKNLLIQLLFSIGLLSAIDYAFQRYDFMNNLKMTKQETKEEYKQMEGDPFIKGSRRQKQRQMAMHRMMSVLPEATVIITNPTHFAIAIRYRHGVDVVPIVLAKGVDYQALRIREKAKDLKIPIIENKPLARTLYHTTDVNQGIPMDLYQAVADVLVLVVKLQRKEQYR